MECQASRFFSGMEELRIFCRRLRASVRLRIFGPIRQYLLAQFANLFDGSGFGFMSRASFGNGLINGVCDQQQASPQLRTSCETFIQTRFVCALI